VVIESDGDSLLLKSFDRVLAEVQAVFAPYRQPRPLASEELIAERRTEAEREDRDRA
jgi:hypothetical protein